MIKKIIKKILPNNILLGYHYLLAKLAAWYYVNPSEEIIVIGVTGTNGKTTTVNFISQYLECLGQSTGLMSTANFKISSKEWLNDKKMTMLGRFQTQKLLRQMVNEGCQYAIVETSSQGIEQFRHKFINYDVVVFTNLTPEHIEAHGSFENYRAAKEKLFQHLVDSKEKSINGKKISKAIVANADDKEIERLRKYKVDTFLTYGMEKQADYKADNVELDNGFVCFDIRGQKIKTNFLGKFTTYNILGSLAAVDTLGFKFRESIFCALESVPGRQEIIDAGQDFLVIVDYAPEPVSLKNIYNAIDTIHKRRLIHILGSCGGGRDRARQPVMGKMAAEKADVVIITNEDPYDDDPEDIIDNVSKGAQQAGKVLNESLFEILDRKQAIRHAFSLAKVGDLVLITGKGAEQAICIAGGKKIPWDDREVARELLSKYAKK